MAYADSPTPEEYIQQRSHWADARFLTRSRRRACGHGLRGKKPGYEHAECCLSSYRELLDHGTLWNRNGKPAVLIAHSYDSPFDIELAAISYAIEHNASITIGDPVDAFYGHGTTPIRIERSTTPQVWINVLARAESHQLAQPAS